MGGARGIGRGRFGRTHHAVGFRHAAFFSDKRGGSRSPNRRKINHRRPPFWLSGSLALQAKIWHHPFDGRRMGVGDSGRRSGRAHRLFSESVLRRHALAWRVERFPRGRVASSGPALFVGHRRAFVRVSAFPRAAPETRRRPVPRLRRALRTEPLRRRILPRAPFRVARPVARSNSVLGSRAFNRHFLGVERAKKPASNGRNRVNPPPLPQPHRFTCGKCGIGWDTSSAFCPRCGAARVKATRRADLSELAPRYGCAALAVGSLGFYFIPVVLSDYLDWSSALYGVVWLSLLVFCGWKFFRGGN